MSSFHQIEQSTYEHSTPAWGAVFVMSLCCAVLIASEFMPVSLLTPISLDLNISEVKWVKQSQFLVFLLLLPAYRLAVYLRHWTDVISFYYSPY